MIRRFKQALRAHPELLDELFAMPIAEAHRIATAMDMPSFEEMIFMTKTKYTQYSAEQWDVFARVIERTKAVSRRKRVGRRVWSIAVASLSLVIVMFFSLIPTGRAWAMELYDYFTRVCGDQADIIRVYPNAVTDGSLSGLSEELTVLESVEAFEKATGLTPFLLNTNDLDLDCVQASYSQEFGCELWLRYVNDRGDWVRVRQLWFAEQELGMGTSYSEFSEAIIRNNIRLYYSVDPVTGTMDGLAVLNDSFLMIAASGSLSMDKLLNMLK